MLNKPIMFLIVGFVLGSIPFLTLSFAEDESLIPSWIKNTAKFWVEGGVSDTEFLNALQFLIKEGVLEIPESTQEKSVLEISNTQNQITEQKDVLTTVINKRIDGEEAFDLANSLLDRAVTLTDDEVAEYVFTEPTQSNFVLVIFANDEWNGVIMDGTSMVSIDGTTHALIPFKCQNVGIKIYNANIQKMTDDGKLMLMIFKNNVIIDIAETEAAYGIVGLSGDCKTPERFN